MIHVLSEVQPASRRLHFFLRSMIEAM